MFKREDVTHGQQPCTVVSVCLFLYFNCYIFPVLIWAKRAASAESGTSKDTSPSLTSCLSLWRGPGSEMGDWKGSADPWLEWVWWANCSPQWTQTFTTEGWLSEEQKPLTRSGSSWKMLLPSLAFISGYLHVALLLISVSCVVYLNVRIISDIPYHSTVPSIILLQISDFCKPGNSPRKTCTALCFSHKHAVFLMHFWDAAVGLICSSVLWL